MGRGEGLVTWTVWWQARENTATRADSGLSGKSDNLVASERYLVTRADSRAVADSHENLVTKIWRSVLGGLRVIGKGRCWHISDCDYWRPA